MLKNRKFTDDEIKKICSSLVVLIDRREKTSYMKDWCNHKSRCQYKEVTLSQGDYSFMLPANEEFGITHDLYFDREIVVEKKSGWDELSQNLTKNRSRFEEELAMFNGKMAILVLEPHDTLFMGTYTSKYDRKSFIASVMTFRHRYNVTFESVTSEAFPVWVYGYLYYYLRSVLKGEQN